MASPSQVEVVSKSQLSVQELAKEPISQIPKHYSRPLEQLTDETCAAPPIVRTIDLQKLITGKTQPIELQNLHSACKELGIFQLVNHGVSSSIVEKLRYEIEEFFKLPFEEKIKYKRRPGDVEGYGQTLLVSDDQKLDWADRLYMFTNPVHRRKSHLLPEFPPPLRNVLETYLSELQKLARKLFLLLATALKIDKKEMEELFENGMQAVRMSYYPPCPQPELTVGLSPHSDASGLSVLLQVNAVEGLQIKKDGVWYPVGFLPDALMVNVGDILEIISNGAYTSIEHRATVNSTKERISIATFFNPKFEAEIGPAKSSREEPPLYKTINMTTYVNEFFSRKLDGKTYLETMKLKHGGDSFMQQH